MDSRERRTPITPITPSPSSLQRGVRPAAYLLSAASAVAVAVWGSLAHSGGFDFSPSLVAPVAAPAAAAPHHPTTAIPAVAAISSRSPAHGRISAPNAAADVDSVMYAFDGGPGHLMLDPSGQPPLAVIAAAGGALRVVKHGAGQAVGFPARCDDPGATACPRAILATTGDVSGLNPGRQRIRFGASVRIRGGQTDDGENLVQKGYSTGGSQYKLQVDGAAGKPSCAVVGTAGPKIYLARSSVSVDDGAWHTIVCDLHGGVLRVTVDGKTRGRRTVPTTATISNDDELRIGGKGKSVNNDQFNGELDDVWVTVGR